MRKCEHGVFWPEGLEVNSYCSGCRPATHMIKLWDHGEKDGDEVKTTVCPICSSKEFNYVNETEYNCPLCGFTVGDIF